MSTLRFLADFAGGPSQLAATVSETSLSSAVATAGVHLGASVAETSTSSAAAASSTAGARTVAEVSTSSASAAGARAIAATATETSTSTLAVQSNHGGVRTVTETSTSDLNAVPYGPNSLVVNSASVLVASASIVGARVVYETSTSDASSAEYQSAFADLGTSLSSDTAASSTSSAGAVSETSLSDLEVTNQQRKAHATVEETSASAATTSTARLLRVTVTSLSSDSVFVQAKQTGFQVRVREKPPLRLTVGVSTPAGVYKRWGEDDPDPRYAPSGLSFSTTMPGGDEELNLTLARDPALSYPDLQELSTLTLFGAGGRDAIAQYRLEQLPDQSGDQMAVSPGAVGWQAAFGDDNSARMIFVDQALSSWQGPSVQRQLQWLQNAGGPVMAAGPTVAPDFTTGKPSLVTEIDNTWTEAQIAEAWYDAHGIPIGKLFARWNYLSSIFSLTSAPDFAAAMFLASEDTGVNYDQINPIPGYAGGSQWLNASVARYFAILQFFNDRTPGGKDGVNYQLFWQSLAVYGAHGLPLYATSDASGALGVLASDVAAYIVNRWCPSLSYSTGSAGSIQPSSFVIPQLVFLDPSKPSDMLTESTKYELLDWAVEPGPNLKPTFYMNARGARGRRWRARTGQAKLQQAGPQIDRVWNGVVVQWTDVTGINRTVGPTDAGANYADSTLRDSDPLNPVNEAGIRRYALVTMGAATLAAAKQIGRLFLQEQKLLDTSGQATLTGYVQDADTGIWWPAYKVRAGDQISFTDASESGFRRIVHTQYNDAEKSNAIQLDQPPDSLDALLARLSVVLSPYGLS